MYAALSAPVYVEMECNAEYYLYRSTRSNMFLFTHYMGVIPYDARVQYMLFIYLVFRAAEFRFRSLT